MTWNSCAEHECLRTTPIVYEAARALAALKQIYGLEPEVFASQRFSVSVFLFLRRVPVFAERSFKETQGKHLKPQFGRASLWVGCWGVWGVLSETKPGTRNNHLLPKLPFSINKVCYGKCWKPPFLNGCCRVQQEKTTFRVLCSSFFGPKTGYQPIYISHGRF